ncbi:homoserine kinase, partial [Candidatus Bathyarchaeota archaeon]
MTIKQVRVYSPGSIANLGPGFDVFGVALEGIGDIIVLEESPEPGVKIDVQGVGADKIPSDPEKNSSGAILNHVIDQYEPRHGFNVEIRKGIPPGTGMGSSGASAAATTVAVNEMLGLHLSDRELVKLAALGEGVVAGAPHADNVAASLLGGFILVGEDWDVIRLDAPRFDIVVVVPDIYIENKTKKARELLPQKIPLKDAVKNIMHASRMALAISRKDGKMFGSNINDRLVEPYRAAMIPNFWDVKQAALDAGAYGCSISGGGPSLFAVGDNIYDI